MHDVERLISLAESIEYGSAALSERRSCLAKNEPSIVTKVVSFICFQDQEVLL